MLSSFGFYCALELRKNKRIRTKVQNIVAIAFVVIAHVYSPSFYRDSMALCPTCGAAEHIHISEEGE